MLKSNRSITLNGQSVIDNKVVVSLTATIPDTTGIAQVTQYTNDDDLYAKHRSEVRSDIRAFDDLVYEIEDEMAQQAATEPEEEPLP